jgi:choline kinase
MPVIYAPRVLLEKILTELITLNENFSDYYREWKNHQEQHEKLFEQGNEGLEIFKKATEKLSPEEMTGFLRSGEDIAKIGKRLMEDKDREDKEWCKKLEGSTSN